MNKFEALYTKLLSRHGKQGWWPVNNAYHKKDYSYPKTDRQRFEICIGAILTQNTSWSNVEKALINLKKANLIDASSMSRIDDDELKQYIRSAGYYNQKTKKLKIFAEFYLSLKGRTPTRDELLNLWGVGKETADSILLYAYHVPVFVIDTYTRRLLLKEKIIKEDQSYDETQELFHKNVKKDHKKYNEFHALIVKGGKQSIP